MKISRIVHQTYSTAELPWIYKKIIDSNLKLNGDWTFKLWTDSELEDWILATEPSLYSLFTKCPLGVQRGDLARLLLIYHYGGLYIDLDIEILKPLNEILEIYLQNPDKLMIASEPSDQIKYLYNIDFYACNAFMMSAPRNPLLAHAIDTIRGLYEIHGLSILERFNIFGGPLLTKLINEWDAPRIFTNIIREDLVYPINDIKLKDIPSYSKDIKTLMTGNFPTSALMVHYWIHGDFESKIRVFRYVGDQRKPVHVSVYELLQPIYELQAIK